jgi:hypothetical protein
MRSLAPLAGRGRGEGAHRESVCVERAPHPDLLRASFARLGPASGKKVQTSQNNKTTKQQNNKDDDGQAASCDHDGRSGRNRS